MADRICILMGEIMNSIKEIIAHAKIEEINHDKVYKIIAVIIVAVLLLFTYYVCLHGFSFIPVIGEGLDKVLYYISYLYVKITELIKEIIYNI